MEKNYKPRLRVLLPGAFIYTAVVSILFVFLPVEVGWVLIAFYLSYLAYKTLYFTSIKYQVRDFELHKFQGVLTKLHDSVPFRNITNLRVRQNLWQRLLGVATLEVQTAGTPDLELRLGALSKGDAEELERLVR